MDLKTYFQLFWLPAVASAVLMLLLWERSGTPGDWLTAWFLLALAVQYIGSAPGSMWLAGLVLQTALAVFLLLKHRLDQL